MSEPGFDLRRDGLGIGAFAIGTFFAVLGCVALWKQEPLGEATGSGALADLWLSSIGALPGLLLSGGVAWLGARTWLSGRTENLLRNVLALTGLSLAFAFLCGALSSNAGGRFGFATGGLISESLHPAAGIVAGLFAIAAVLWFGWLRFGWLPRFGWLRHARTGIDERSALRDPDAPAGAVADDGVSAAEAAALIPEDFHRAIDAGRKQLAPPSPYPEDVRRRGEIPAGARPLHPLPDVRPEPEDPSQPASKYRWTAARSDESFAAGADLAATRRVEEAFDAATEAEPTRLPVEARSDLIERGSTDRDDEPQVEPLEPLPRPSWEQSNLFIAEDEPVDAYGTPLSLVEALRRSQKDVAEAFEAEAGSLPIAASDNPDAGETVEEERDLDAAEDLAAEEEEEVDLDEEGLDEPSSEEEDDEDDELGEAAREHEPVVQLTPAARPARGAQRPEPGPVEREVVLQPRRAEHAGPSKLIADAGCLFLDRGRVAVSMLQRQYGMDFDDACRVLDELQELGLIGPYLGGQRRDILLTREQWLERVSGA